VDSSATANPAGFWSWPPYRRRIGQLGNGSSSGLDGLDSCQISRIELLEPADHRLMVNGRAILMATNLGPSESLTWWVRAAQARRIATMLTPRDAQLAEAYARECEDQARGVSGDGIQAGSSASSHRVVNPAFKPVRRVSSKRAA
jgi:hypothetical protein